eukprot:gene19342-8_t
MSFCNLSVDLSREDGHRTVRIRMKVTAKSLPSPFLSINISTPSSPTQGTTAKFYKDTSSGNFIDIALVNG